MEEKRNHDNLLITIVGRLSRNQRLAIWMLGDLLAFILGTIVSMIILWNIIKPSNLLLISYTILSFLLFAIIGHQTKILGQINRYLNINDLFSIFLLTCVAQLLTSIVIVVSFQWFSIRFTLLSMIIAAVLTLAIRVLWQQLYFGQNKAEIMSKPKTRKVIVMGAGDGGSYFLDSYRRNPGNIEVLAVLDSDKSKHGQAIGGVTVLGNLDKLPELKAQGAEEVIIAIPSLSSKAYEEILTECNRVGLKVYKMPKVEDVIQGVIRANQNLPKVEITDLLGREEVKLDETLLRKELENKTILVTGAGGSIGSEIVRQVSRFNPRKILLLGHGENSIYLIYHEMLKQQKMIQYVPVIADIQDKERLLQIMRDEQPDIVYHAAAHKHVPLMEMNPIESYKNNILGTYNVATAVHETGVKKMVMISTDKAVNPPNVMGASKRVAELIITGIAQQSDSIFCAVRFGNVLGSRGSVIPVFIKQIAEGGPVTVTDFRMTRYFMTIPEASKLVIHAGAFAQSGEVFVLDMGEPVKIVDLAKKLILLSGYSENEIEIVESGIRPGEKLFEEILLDGEKGDRQIEGKIFVGNVARRPLSEIETFIKELQKDDPQKLKETIVNFANSHEGEN
ncbi:NDP-sugar epimerase, includes UDP-GlcNAc-inverting 4,6-dehydratase FlaA1 and capsular polysaccharide biosynthesis protein EpsC [Globicatella sulfidifaciens DSM 15739]|uniref:NDP-sugar epimerase, includes UDP-GlcNAc-inverting 4,6-dehydratase FlaA1 and capsular polysaccharide biosynthesis protein EpsC n=2 Tax=Globicatella sulfidifaciens TaxID=136093 RepID=A0A1T4NRL1_9LACT|nr:nucleoside-diphosphate sugar epimerase/dehydratase [Globicatella sulfidifaciens]SJZ81899.1 NDP-sugar epimerase, includes UDP-GlcNAc-inverting 4,6-dehydratase FlaA1 and capsular polysaccharide biosynthesis protein EpsC [Globicatella sulfidifaciens DSM 15739]